MYFLCNMYLTMFPVAVGGILNMIFTKTKFYNKHKYPIDHNKTLKDNKRIFGDNKTYIGFISMIIFCIISQVFCGLICNLFDINQHHDLFKVQNNTILLNLWFGALTGFVYMLFELPNSFIKRRINISPGKTNKGFVGFIFLLIDQIDSLVGVMFLLILFADISILKYVGYVALGAITHVTINLVLFLLKVRKNI